MTAAVDRNLHNDMPQFFKRFSDHTFDQKSQPSDRLKACVACFHISVVYCFPGLYISLPSLVLVAV